VLLTRPHAIVGGSRHGLRHTYPRRHAAGDQLVDPQRVVVDQRPAKRADVTQRLDRIELDAPLEAAAQATRLAHHDRRQPSCREHR
jgi:hypothetical protein